MPLSQYQMATPGVSQMGVIGHQIAVNMARQRYQQDLMRQQMMMKQAEMASQAALDRQRGNLYGQQTRTSESQQGFNEARTGQIQDTQKAKGQLGDAAWLMRMVQAGQKQGIDMGPREDIAAAQAIDAMARLPDAQRSGLPENMAQMSQMGDPRFQQMLGLGQKPVVNVGPGATAFDALNQEPMFQSPRTLGEGQVLRLNVEGQQGLPRQFAPSAGNQLSQNTAVQAMMDPMFTRLPPQMQQAIRGMQINTGQTNQQITGQGGIPNLSESAGMARPFQMGPSVLPQPASPTLGKEAQGGYEIGRKYGGLIYNGGDPNDETNWSQ